MSAGNGRYGGGSAGSEHRFHFPAADAAHFDEARTGVYVRTSLQGESSSAVGADINTMGGPPRGTIVGATYNCCWPTNGFKK
jgi:hypothetical protein